MKERKQKAEKQLVGSWMTIPEFGTMGGIVIRKTNNQNKTKCKKQRNEMRQRKTNGNAKRKHVK